MEGMDWHDGVIDPVLQDWNGGEVLKVRHGKYDWCYNAFPPEME